ncbi:hypothetical protein Gpo141_00002978 [Globisporangium polare]
MTGARTTSAANTTTHEIDFFSLHSRKKKRIDVEMLDYAYVEKSQDVDELKGVLAMLRSGKEGRYPHLERVTEDKILSLLPERERNRINRMRSEPSTQELSSEKEELLSWTQQVDVKHRALQERKSLNRRLPPVRGKPQSDEPASAAAKLITEIKQTANAAASTAEQKPKQAIPAYDFRAWEKYNVDKALEELDAEEEQRKQEARLQREEQKRRELERKRELASLPSYVDFDELSKEEKEVYALHEKQKGNECFKVNENDEAVLYYTRSMAFDDTNAIVYANRAMAYLRTKSFAAAEQDCTRATLLDPTYVKGWSRRGMTRFRRGKYEDALGDFEEALRLEPGSKEIEKLLKKTQDKWRESDGTVQSGSNQDANDYHVPAPPASIKTSTFKMEPQQQQEEKKSEPTAFKRFEIIEESDAESDEDDDPLPQDRQQQGDEDEHGADDVEKPFQRFEIIED